MRAKLTLAVALLFLLTSTACNKASEPKGESIKTPAESTGGEAKKGSTDTKEKPKTESGAAASGVEITLKDELDGVVNSYCLDIAGGNRNVDINNGLQAHTCYSYQGKLGTDQIFDPSKFKDNTLYMPEYKVCVAVKGLEEGAKVGLAPCDNSKLQKISFSKEGTISPVVAPTMCFTAAQETRFGRNGKSKKHQIKDLSLSACSDKLAKFQQWRTRSTDD